MTGDIVGATSQDEGAEMCPDRPCGQKKIGSVPEKHGITESHFTEVGWVALALRCSNPESPMDLAYFSGT